MRDLTRFGRVIKLMTAATALMMVATVAPAAAARARHTNG